MKLVNCFSNIIYKAEILTLVHLLLALVAYVIVYIYKLWVKNIGTLCYQLPACYVIGM